MPHRIATGKNSEANNYSHFPDDSTAFIKSNLSASVLDCGRNHVKVRGTRKRGKENEKREQEAAASVLNLLPPPQLVRKMRNFPPKVLNIQYSPRYEPSGAEGSPGKEKKKKAEEETDAGTRRNFIFPILYRVPRFVEDGCCSLPNQGSS